MANLEQIEALREGQATWNRWRYDNEIEFPDLSDSDLQGFQLQSCDLRGAKLERADLRGAALAWCDLNNASLVDADLRDAKINDARAPYANFSRCKLQHSYLWGSDFRAAVFRNAHLNDANLMCAQLVRADFTQADLTGCKVFGTSSWEVELEGAIQSGLVVSPPSAPEQGRLTVDSLELAQFLNLLLRNRTIRSTIDTVTSKVVLILGNFSPQRKMVLDALRRGLRQHDYVPVLFDFETPKSKDPTGTVQMLANMARFVIADLSEPRSVPHELATIVPGTFVPVQPLLQEDETEYSMLTDLRRRHHWLLDSYRYSSLERLLEDLESRVIVPAEAKARELKRL